MGSGSLALAGCLGSAASNLALTGDCAKAMAMFGLGTYF
jgi:hypothetical protein